MTDSQKWSFTEGWVLMSAYVVQRDEGATLDELIGAADVMNHAIPTSGELTRSLSRLACHGIVKVKDGRYLINPIYLHGIEKAKNSRGGLFELPNKGRRWLQSMTFDTAAAMTIVVNDEQLKAAYQQHREKLRC